MHVLVALCSLHTAAFFLITTAIDHGKPMYVVFIIAFSLNENLLCCTYTESENDLVTTTLIKVAYIYFRKVCNLM